MSSNDGRDPGEHTRDHLTAGRARENEERFAAANAEIATTAEALQIEELVPFLCECSNTRCTKIIQLSLATYADLRSQESTFVLLSGHEDRNVEQVVGRTDGYLLVQHRL